MNSDPGGALRDAAARLVGLATLMVTETNLFTEQYQAASIGERERLKATDGTMPVATFASDLFSTVTKFLASGMPGLSRATPATTPESPTPPSLPIPSADEDLGAVDRVVSDFLNLIDTSLVTALREAAGLRQRLIGHPDLDAKYVRVLEFTAAVEVAARRYLGREETEN